MFPAVNVLPDQLGRGMNANHTRSHACRYKEHFAAQLGNAYGNYSPESETWGAGDTDNGQGRESMLIECTLSYLPSIRPFTSLHETRRDLTGLLLLPTRYTTTPASSCASCSCTPSYGSLLISAANRSRPRLQKVDCNHSAHILSLDSPADPISSSSLRV